MVIISISDQMMSGLLLKGVLVEHKKTEAAGSIAVQDLQLSTERID
jgi:hypothetical protein